MGLFQRNESKKHTTGKRSSGWLALGLLCSAGAAILLLCSLNLFRAETEKDIGNPIENSDAITFLYQNCYLLYRDLYNSEHNTSLDYGQLYLDLGDYQWVLERPRESVFSRYDEEDYIGDADGKGQLALEEYEYLADYAQRLTQTFQQLENSFSTLNNYFDYSIRDLQTGRELSNTAASDLSGSQGSTFSLGFVFDGEGNISLFEDIQGENPALIRKLANEIIRDSRWPGLESGGYQTGLSNSLSDSVNLSNAVNLKIPSDCIVTFRISQASWQEHYKEYFNLLYNSFQPSANGYASIGYSQGYYYYLSAYQYSGLPVMLVLCMAALFLAGLFLPLPGGTRPWRDNKICSLPLELLLVGACVLIALSESMFDFLVDTVDGSLSISFQSLLHVSETDGDSLSGLLAFLLSTVFFLVCWLLGISARALRESGLKGYLQEKSLIYRFFPFIKRRATAVYHAVSHLDLTKSAHKVILKALIANAVILAVISCFWIGGLPMILIYSLVLYFILRKYVSELQKRYQLLADAANQIADGNLNLSLKEDWGVFESLKPQILKIEEGFQKAVQEKVKSQRMKAELIINVSHDLKTPLTAIITYINLLKEENITEEQRKEYLETLERKSLRLKVLIEDLFEVSKTNSGNITLNLISVDIMNLLKQVEFEMSDKLQAAGLEVRMNLTDEKIILSLDSQKTYRIYENLFGNIAKYALPGTRVYVEGVCRDERVVITLKNISAQEITVNTSELTERFVRGDASRNTEGSGLGLAIAKSFAQLQGGELSVDIDGDLFKVTTTWPYSGV